MHSLHVFKCQNSFLQSTGNHRTFTIAQISFAVTEHVTYISKGQIVKTYFVLN